MVIPYSMAQTVALIMLESPVLFIIQECIVCDTFSS